MVDLEACAAAGTAGMAYLDWLADARRALVLGTDNFIARDFANPAEFLDPSRLLPLLGQLSLPELLGPHHDRYDAWAVSVCSIQGLAGSCVGPLQQLVTHCNLCV